MAVETKQGSANVLPPTNGSAAPGAVPNGQAKQKRKRPSSLMQVASSLPSVEHSLEEFIARANQTLVDGSTWDNAEKIAKQEDVKQREADAFRWKAAELQMREGEAREKSLRGQLDGLQGKLAEAEARAAVAGTASESNHALLDLKSKVQSAEQRLREAEERATHLAHELVAAKTSSTALPAAGPAVEIADFDQRDAEERVRVAEAKATKALAAARAAAAGLRVSQEDLVAIESGLGTDLEPQKKTPWLGIFIAFAGGIAIMFAVSRFVLSKDDKTTTVPVATQPAAPQKPVVTPIEEPKAAAPEAAKQPEPIVPEAAKQPEPVPTAEVAKQPAPIAPTAPDPDPAAAAKQPEPRQTEPAVAKKPPVVAAPKHQVTHTAPKHTTAPTKPAGDLADPFGGGTPAPAAPKKPTKPAKPDKKPAGGIADPF